ncbi:pentatricopeptide repeat-containing protein [Tanacetum coccineum]
MASPTHTFQQDKGFDIFKLMPERNAVTYAWEVRKARELFDEIPKRNVMTWTAMIDRYMKASCFEDGFGLFRQMRLENGIKVVSNTLTIVFEGCGRSDSRLGDLDSASKLFIVMLKKDNVSRNSLIGGYIQAEKIKEAYKHFNKLHMDLMVMLYEATTAIKAHTN